MRSVVITLILAFTPPASAGFDSAYSDLQPEDKSVCKLVTAVEPGDEAMSSGGFECKGYKNFKVRFAEGDLRSFVSFGKRPVGIAPPAKPLVALIPLAKPWSGA
jgi:hypothetical protein